MNSNEKFLALVALSCFVMFLCVGNSDQPAYFMSGMFCVYGLIWGRLIKEPQIHSKNISITDVINRFSI